MAGRMIETSLKEEDIRVEGSLRPKQLDDYIGQSKIKENLKIYIEAAKKRQDPLDHVLFYGPPGLGKTTLAGIIANEMQVNMKVTSGPCHLPVRHGRRGLRPVRGVHPHRQLRRVLCTVRLCSHLPLFQLQHAAHGAQ